MEPVIYTVELTEEQIKLLLEVLKDHPDDYTPLGFIKHKFMSVRDEIQNQKSSG